ncbi:MAG TPA: glycosyltransferase family 1 protein [Saprospiraceae bacterium]|nr:glycosyltransferase family 1 protein [Saprospiraceae bacterium]HMQ85291.1 glycosyltransferase family 1 protein [Saprospiraceae bacterium]
MRVAVNTRFLLSDKLEGIGRYTYEIVRRLVERHTDWEFIFLFDRPFDPGFVFGKNVKAVVIAPPARHPFLWYIWFEHSVARALNRYQPHVFFSPDAYLSLTAKTPTVLTIHDLAHEYLPEQLPVLVRNYYRYFVPRYCRRADRIVSVSDFSRQDIEQIYRIPAEKISVTGNGCREGLKPLTAAEKTAAKTQFASGKDYFLFIGAIHPRKNVHRLLQAFELFKQRSGSEVKLVLCGRMAWKTDEVARSYQQSQYRDDIIFTGFLPDQELPRLLGGALAFVYPSLFEGFGIPVLEAMHCEVPVLSSNASALPEVVGQAGLLLSPFDVNGWAEAMQRIWFDEALQRELVDVGKQQRRLFSWERATDVVEQAIIGIAGQNNK